MLKPNINEQIARYYARHKARFSAINLLNSKKEVQIAAELASILGARTEIVVPFNLGRADILSNDYLIETKYCPGVTAAKQAIGQLLMYSYALQFQGHLAIGQIGNDIHPGIQHFCKANNISIFYYNHLTDCKWRLLYDYQKKKS